jgi:lipopolysaccharide biosynthesis glycosyltransferase
MPYNPARNDLGIALPASFMQTVHIACCFDRAFAVPAAVLATSILVHAHPGRRYVLHALYDGEDDFGPRLFEAFHDTKLAIEVHRITNPFAGVPTSRASLSAAAYVRLALPEFLPKTAKVVYLDVDTLCLADVGTLFDTDLGDAPIAASLDPPMVNLLAYEQRRGRGASKRSVTQYLEHELGLGDAKARYFNSGVLVLDLDRLRAEMLTERSHELLKRMGSRIRLDDQCVLNAFYAKRYHPLPARWNAMLCLSRLRIYAWSGVQLMTRVAEAWHDPAVLHFCQSTKPWVPNCHETIFAPVWRAYALAAPLPWRLKLRLAFSGPRQLLRYLRPSVHRRAAELRAQLRLSMTPSQAPARAAEAVSDEAAAMRGCAAKARPVIS